MNASCLWMKLYVMGINILLSLRVRLCLRYKFVYLGRVVSNKLLGDKNENMDTNAPLIQISHVFYFQARDV